MATFHSLQIQRRELLDELDELEAAITELTAILHAPLEVNEEQHAEQQERLGWLQRQQASILVTLGETERELLASGAEDWDGE